MINNCFDKLIVRFICDGAEILVCKGKGINPEPTSVSLYDEQGTMVKTSDLRMLQYPDGHPRLTLQELSMVRQEYFKKDWDAVGKLLCKM